MFILLVCIIALILSVYGTRWYIVSSESFLDHPDERKPTKRKVASGGGISFFVSFSIGMIALTCLDVTTPRDMAIVVMGVVLVFLGRIDDRWGISAKARLFMHLVISIVCSYHLLTSGPVVLPLLNIEPMALKMIFATLLVGWFINLFNFMDGCDGLVASVSALSAILLGVFSWAYGDMGHMAIYFLLAACLLGFLRFNWQRAKVFMGDSGSCFLGFAFAYLALSSSRVGATPLVLNAVILSQFIFDPTYTMVFRIARRKTVFRPHREFAFHQAMIRGASHREICYYHLATTLFFLAPLAYLGYSGILTWWVIMLVVFFALLAYQMYFSLYKGIRES